MNMIKHKSVTELWDLFQPMVYYKTFINTYWNCDFLQKYYGEFWRYFKIAKSLPKLAKPKK